MPIRLELAPGRLRKIKHGLLLVVVAAASWDWFGLSGLIPALIWWWHRGRPVPITITFFLDEVQFAQLGPFRVFVGLPGLRRLEVFRDELPLEDYSELRRQLKARLQDGSPEDLY